MPPRLNHKKSRGGCTRCKKRKVKCDEQLPSCTWCLNHGLSCIYSEKAASRPQRELRQLKAKTIPNSSVHRNDSHDLSLALSQETPERRKLELAIWHYYIVTVVPKFPYASESEELHLHQTNIPILAVLHPCLLNVLLALATLYAWTSLKDHIVTKEDIPFLPHLELLTQTQTLSPSALDELETVHSHYFDLALQDQRHEVGHLGTSNADAVAVTAVFINHCAIVHNTVAAANADSTYEVPLQWLMLANAMASVIQGARPFLTSESTMTQIMRRFSIPGHNSESFRIVDSNDLGEFVCLLDYDKFPEDTILTQDERRVYFYEVWFINYLYSFVQTTHSWHGLSRRIFACIALMPDEFIAFLRQKRPRALVILAHVLAMTYPLHSHWWEFRHVGKFNVSGIASLVPPEWAEAMSWPLRVLEGDVLHTDDLSVE